MITDKTNNKINEFINKWKDTVFEDLKGDNLSWKKDGATPEYNSFLKDYKGLLKTICKDIDFSLNKINDYHFAFSAYLTNNANNNEYQFMICDVRYCPDDWYKDVIYASLSNTQRVNNGSYQQHCELKDFGNCLVELDKTIENSEKNNVKSEDDIER